MAALPQWCAHQVQSHATVTFYFTIHYKIYLLIVSKTVLNLFHLRFAKTIEIMKKFIMCERHMSILANTKNGCFPEILMLAVDFHIRICKHRNDCIGTYMGHFSTEAAKLELSDYCQLWGCFSLGHKLQNETIKCFLDF